MSREETVEVIIKLPRTVVDFIRAMEGDVEESITQDIMELQVSYVESICNDETEDPGTLMEKYNLKPAFKAYGVLPSYYGDP